MVCRRIKAQSLQGGHMSGTAGSASSRKLENPHRSALDAAGGVLRLCTSPRAAAHDFFCGLPILHDDASRSRTSAGPDPCPARLPGASGRCRAGVPVYRGSVLGGSHYTWIGLGVVDRQPLRLVARSAFLGQAVRWPAPPGTSQSAVRCAEWRLLGCADAVQSVGQRADSLHAEHG